MNKEKEIHELIVKLDALFNEACVSNCEKCFLNFDNNGNNICLKDEIYKRVMERSKEEKSLSFLEN